MIRTLLVANRGEIAVRVARSARELGIEPVAVFSESDAGAFHVGQMRRAESLGGGSVRETYLSIPRLLDAARRAGADAVHPGYGFLSENAEFARAVGRRRTGLGRPAARGHRRDGGQGAVPGAGCGKPAFPSCPAPTRPRATDAELSAEADRVGFPLLVKASAGGGGKGMARVDDPADLARALGEARRLAAAAFGDDTVYLEQLLEGAHHVEFQIFGDASGHVVHLFERECSVQRRHQKIVEETPSPALDGALRRAGWPRRPSRRDGPSDTSARERSSSCSTRSATSISSR